MDKLVRLFRISLYFPSESMVLNRKIYNAMCASKVVLAARVVPLLIVLTASSVASADEADAKRLLKAMSDYVTAQKDLAFDYDATLEVVTPEGQILGLASSGTVSLQRPGKIHVTRAGGFADVDMIFDGTTLTLLGNNLNMYAQLEIPGTLTNLVDVLRNDYNRTLPAADLLLPDSYDFLMADVVDIKDLGSGVIGGVECDTLAFRTDEVDWQIWIAQGDEPYPCSYVITSKQATNGPQYRVQVSNWKAGAGVGDANYSFTNDTQAQQVDLGNLGDANDLPEQFEMIGESQ